MEKLIARAKEIGVWQITIDIIINNHIYNEDEKIAELTRVIDMYGVLSKSDGQIGSENMTCH